MSLEKSIQNLHYDIIRYIYKEFIEPELYLKLFTAALKTDSSKYLRITDIRMYIPVILSKPLVVKHFHKHLLYFKEIYKSHKIDKNKFLLLTNGDSFALYFLMHLYH